MKQFLIIGAALLAAASCCTAAQADGGTKRAFTIEDVYRIKTAYGPKVSAKGDMVYTLSQSDLHQQKSTSNIYDADGRAITTDGKSYAPQWSGDGRYIYYTSSRGGLPQVWRVDATTLAAEQLTDYKLGVQGAVVSPDGHYIAFAAEVDPDLNDPDGSLNKAAMEAKRKNPIQAHIADHLLYRHWTEYSDDRYWHIIIFDTQKKTYTDVTPGRFHSPVFSPSGPSGFAFSPDSKELCYTSNHDEHPEASTNCDLWVVSMDDVFVPCLTADNKAWDGSPQYSPDGRYIAYRFQRTPGYESDRFILGLIDRTTGERRVLTEGFDNWVDDYKWSADSKTIYFLGEVRGAQPLYSVDIKTGKIKTVIDGKAISAFDIDGKGNVYYNYSTTGKPTAIYYASVENKEKRRKNKVATSKPSSVSSLQTPVSKEGTQLTHYNDSLEAAVDFRPSERMWVTGAGGDSVEVFVVKPHGFDPAKKYPLVINVHGGPQMQWMDSYRADWQVYPGAGYVVAYPNPHGSTGYGQQFCRDISGSWGGKPYEDVMRVTDALTQLAYVDSTRMGAMGWSYGGYFMNWLQGQTKRFKCLASMMGLYDLRSMWGATEELWFPNFDLEGQPWNSPLYKKWSPSEYVRNFATPTLVITGERDYRVPYTQALQYFSTLQTLGIPSRLIVFDNDGHWPSNLKSMPLYYNAHLEWFHKYLGGQPAPWDSEQMVKKAPY